MNLDYQLLYPQSMFCDFLLNTIYMISLNDYLPVKFIETKHGEKKS